MTRSSLSGVCAAVFALAALQAAPAHERAPLAGKPQAAPAPDLAALAGERLAEVRHWSEVPAGVRQALERHWDEPGIADPEEAFQQYDFPTEGKQTRRRLVLAAKASQAWLVCYEHGGIELGFRLAVVPFGTDRVPGEPTWFGILVATTAQEVKDLPSLRTAIREHRTWEVKPPYI
ncbi:MAG TPA: hypothetical protein VJA16_09220 [Thermoanaerobaculia bacterium]